MGAEVDEKGMHRSDPPGRAPAVWRGAVRPHHAFWHWSIKFTSVANSTLLANLASIFVTLAVWLLWRQRPSGVFLAGLGTALAGVAMLVRTSLEFSPTALLGDALGVITAMFYAWYLLTVKSLRDLGAATLRLMAVTTTLTAAILLPLALVSGEAMMPQSARGWLVLQPNYRGSDNLGGEFQRAINNDAGAGPGRDVMSGVDLLIKRGIADPARMAVSGWSYGGYMTA